MVNPLIATLQRPVLRRRNARRLVIDSPAGVNEERFLTINGYEQWVTMRGRDRQNPVLLILHGGPGSSYIPFNPWLTEWEKHFTIVQWDQPGAGKTFQRNGRTDPVGLSLSRLTTDGIELTDQLRDLFGCRKVIVLGSSVGSLIGSQMVRRRPDLFDAYVGVNQNSPGSDPVGYRLARQAAQQQDDRKGLRLLEEMGPDPSRWTIDQHEGLMKLAIRVTKGVPNMVYDLMLPALMFAPCYTMSDIKDYQRAMTYTLRQVFEELRAFDRRDPHDEFAIPTFFFMGERDIITPTIAAREYFGNISAPRKEFVVIEGAGHLAEFANPRQLLHELLVRVRPLATPHTQALQ
ncbi:alpha/beta hydrolase [Nonomuraea sp. NPDC048916]|uniref:alpha/beta fold hydrolase n=1 Tax=Nonomuraea sp. NPDC048916 TaxID=3154232 RepID=UPI0033FF72F7